MYAAGKKLHFASFVATRNEIATLYTLLACRAQNRDLKFLNWTQLEHNNPFNRQPSVRWNIGAHSGACIPFTETRFYYLAI